VQKINAELAGTGISFQLGRTGAHEFGHGAGLGHLRDSQTGEIIREDLGNIMQQSKYSQGCNA
jgi:hypothetical protein